MGERDSERDSFDERPSAPLERDPGTRGHPLRPPRGSELVEPFGRRRHGG
jgi:hypothetical protein